MQQTRNRMILKRKQRIRILRRKKQPILIWNPNNRMRTNFLAAGELCSSWFRSAEGWFPTVWGNVPKGQKGRASFKIGGQAIPQPCRTGFGWLRKLPSIGRQRSDSAGPYAVVSLEIGFMKITFSPIQKTHTGTTIPVCVFLFAIFLKNYLTNRKTCAIIKVLCEFFHHSRRNSAW